MIRKSGKVSIDASEIWVEFFTFESTTHRTASLKALLWAQERLNEEIKWIILEEEWEPSIYD